MFLQSFKEDNLEIFIGQASFWYEQWYFPERTLEKICKDKGGRETQFQHIDHGYEC